MHLDHGFWGWIIFIFAVITGIISLFLFLDLMSAALRYGSRVTFVRLIRNALLIVGFGLLSYYLFVPVLHVSFG